MKSYLPTLFLLTLLKKNLRKCLSLKLDVKFFMRVVVRKSCNDYIFPLDHKTKDSQSK